MTRRRLSRTAVVAVIGLFAALATASSAHARTFHMPGGGRVVAPAGSLSPHARIVAEPIAARSRLGRLHRNALSLRVVHGRLLGPVTLTLPYRGRLRHSGVGPELLVDLVYYDARARRWRSVPAAYDARTRTVSATVSHLSVWDLGTWDWLQIAGELNQAVGRFRGGRTDGPKCAVPNNLPRWIDPEVHNEDGQPIRTCAEGWDGQRAVIKVVNNRPYGMFLHLGTPVDRASHATPEGLGKALAATFADVLAAPDEVYLPPLTETQVVFAPRSSWITGEFRAAVTAKSLMSDLVGFGTEKYGSFMTEKVFGKLVKSCSWMVKPRADGAAEIDAGDPLGMVEGLARCLESGIVEAQRAGLLDDRRAADIQKRMKVLAAIKKLAHWVNFAFDAGDVADYFLQAPERRFSVAYGSLPPAGSQPTSSQPTSGQPSSGGSVVAPPKSPGPTPTPNRQSIVSYDRMTGGAPYHGWFDQAWQPFVAQSNTITSVGVTVGNRMLTPGVAVPYNVVVRLCSGQPTGVNGCPGQVAQASPQIVNYGNSAADIGDVAVTKGATYWVQWLQPPQAGGDGWVTYWWGGGSTLSSSDQMQMIVKGYDR